MTWVFREYIYEMKLATTIIAFEFIVRMFVIPT